MAKALREILEKRAGLKECEFTLPYVFLPPRYIEVSGGRNMILVLDQDCVAQIRWEGSAADPYQDLTPGAVRRLMKDVSRNIKKYRKELGIFARFVDRTAEEPFWNPREDSLDGRPEEKGASLNEEEGEEIVAVAIGGQLVQGKASKPIQMEESAERGKPLDFGW